MLGLLSSLFVIGSSMFVRVVGVLGRIVGFGSIPFLISWLETVG